MPRIMFFELKKMLTRRVALVVNVGVLVMLCGIMALNVVQARFALSDGSFIGGPAAIQAAREEREARAGQLSVERILSDVQGYRELVLSELDAADLLEMTDAAAYSAAAQAFTDEQFDTLYDPYWSWLMSPFRRSGEEPYQTAVRVSDEEFADYYEAVAQLAQDTLDEGQGGSWEYTTAERAYWTDMEASVPEPVSYGWAGAWDNIVSCVAFLAFAMLAVCVTLTPVFSAEYQEGTDAVLLATRYGRSRLVAAKVAASLLYATVYFALAAAIVCGVSVSFYGAGGFDLPLQALSIWTPYPLTCGQAALLSVGLMYACTLDVAGLTLLLSSRTRSALAVIVVDVVVVFLTGMVPSGGSGILEHLLRLFPMGFSNFSTLFTSLTSYPVGPVVLDLVGAVTVTWLALAIVALPLSVVSWRRHQVA